MGRDISKILAKHKISQGNQNFQHGMTTSKQRKLFAQSPVKLNFKSRTGNKTTKNWKKKIQRNFSKDMHRGSVKLNNSKVLNDAFKKRLMQASDLFTDQANYYNPSYVSAFSANDSQ